MPISQYFGVFGQCVSDMAEEDAEGVYSQFMLSEHQTSDPPHDGSTTAPAASRGKGKPLLIKDNVGCVSITIILTSRVCTFMIVAGAQPYSRRNRPLGSSSCAIPHEV